MSPDGRSLSAKVTLPQGSVDNEGKLIADGGTIAALAHTVNNNGLVQANSVRNNNGVIELLASDSVNLGADSVISAQGNSSGISSGGSVTVKSDNTFSDEAGSTISIAGGAHGGDGGQAEVSALQMNSIQSVIQGQAVKGFVGGILTIDPANIWLASAATDPSAPSGYTVIDVNSYNGLSQVNVLADNNITLNTLWTLASMTTPATLSLTAGNNITFDTGSGIIAPNNAQGNWSVKLAAGNTISLEAGTKIQADAGTIKLNAATVELYGTLQAHSINPASGVIDITAGNSVNLGASSFISAQGDSTGISSGGSVTIQSGGTFSDQSGSAIDVSGSTQGGAGGQISISAPQMSAPMSTLKGQGYYTAVGAANPNGSLSLGSDNILVNSDGSPSSAADTLVLNGNPNSSFFTPLAGQFSQISLKARG